MRHTILILGFLLGGAFSQTQFDTLTFAVEMDSVERVINDKNYPFSQDVVDEIALVENGSFYGTVTIEVSRDLDTVTNVINNDGGYLIEAMANIKPISMNFLFEKYFNYRDGKLTVSFLEDSQHGETISFSLKLDTNSYYQINGSGKQRSYLNFHKHYIPLEDFKKGGLKSLTDISFNVLSRVDTENYKSQARLTGKAKLFEPKEIPTQFGITSIEKRITPTASIVLPGQFDFLGRRIVSKSQYKKVRW